MRKRGQSAAGAAVLLAIIMGILVGFILFLPSGERAELLGEKNVSKAAKTPPAKAAEAETLLSVSPGKIDFLGQKEIEHPLPVVTIYTKTETKVLAEKNSVYAQKSLFAEEQSLFRFRIPDPENTEEVLLSFGLKVLEGRLKIQLNGEEVFNAELASARALSLPQNLLREENELLFSVSSPGIAFWATNEVQLENLQIVAEVTNVETRSSTTVFLVSDTEKRNLERITLKFQPECLIAEVGKLTIILNGNQLYQGIPDCDVALIPVEIDPSILQEGENRLTFSTERGTYIISHILIKSQLKEIDFPTYYFKLSKEQYEEVQKETKRVRMKVEFVEAGSVKFGEFVFNSDIIPFDTKEATLTLDLSEEVVLGNNALKIKPKKTVEIRQLKVELVK